MDFKSTSTITPAAPPWSSYKLTKEELPLSNLKQGESGIISRLGTPPPVTIKLMEMGLAVGETIQFIREAPFGDPIEVEVMKTRIALRKSDAFKIFIHQIHLKSQFPHKKN